MADAPRPVAVFMHRHPTPHEVEAERAGLDRLLAMNQGILIFKILMGAFTAIRLIVGGIGIMNVLLASVAERTKEIGVRKAAGARRRDIIVQSLAESVVISMAGATIGAILVGLIFGTYPALKAANPSPVDAMRYEQARCQRWD